MNLYKIKYYSNGNTITAVVKAEGLGKAITMLEGPYDANNGGNFSFSSYECLDNKVGILHRDFQEEE